MAPLSNIYGALLILGGLMGARKGSMPSLIAGGTSGVIIILLEYLFSSAKATKGSALIALAEVFISSTLTLLMAQRYAGSGKFMPAGLVALMSGGMSAVYAARLFDAFTAKSHKA